MKNKLYLILYYICFALTLGTSIFVYSLTTTIIMVNKFMYFFIGINVVLTIIFTILLKKKKYEFDNILLPISYLILFIFLIVISVIYNNILLVEYIHLSYYLVILLFYDILLNIYSILSIKN
ncbi:MAG: hypothetical protein II119_01680 [Bacilli bacterium]|nr:hypothetical protein [Bacilli bacterium]